MKVMRTQTGSLTKFPGAATHSCINEKETYLILPKTVKICMKLASYDSISMMQCYANLPQLSLSSKKVIHCLPSSESEAGMGAEITGISKTVRVKFQLKKECQFGDHFHIIGDDPILGSWNPSEAIPFSWSEGHIWILVLELPIEKPIQYKLLLKKSTGEILWQPDADRSFRAWETKNVITVTEEWDNAETQQISEEQQILKENEELISIYSEENALTVNSHVKGLGSDDNVNAADRNGEHLTEIPSSRAVKNSRSSDRNARRKVEYEGNLVTCDEGPVLVPGLTLSLSSSSEAQNMIDGPF